MPHSPDKWKTYFADLGRPTKRGIRKCPKCGTLNGTRGNYCKNRSCDVVFRRNGAAKKNSTEACKIVVNIPELQVFSARLRDRGPDYRNFVQIPSGQGPTTLPNPNVEGQEDELFNKNSKCYVDACIKTKEFPCSHIQAAYRCFSESQPLSVKHSIIPTLNIPTEHQQTLLAFMSEPNDVLVQRVSKTSFVVKCTTSNKHPLGYLHIMFFKHNKDGGMMAEKKFLCTCKSFKMQSRQTDASQQQQSTSSEVLEMDARFCLHYQACLCAFASDDSLSAEFDYFLMQNNQTCSPTLLSQLHLVTLPRPVTATSVDGIDTNHISVEIMQENISLLESIAAADDATLHNVQGLEGVLSDQIIVTNVDDSLSFGDATGLEGLDDGDSQVCQIFASAQNAIQLANAFTTAETVHQTVNITTSAVATASGGKKRRQGSGGDGCSVDVTLIQAPHHVHQTQLFSNSSQFDSASKNAFSSSKSLVGKGSTATFSGQSSGITSTSPPPTSEIVNPVQEVFEFWLSGVNERLNAAMNYQFSGKPEPVVYYISTEYFEKLKERITTGIKKKRLPNQTVIFSRTDKPPAGTFTKHVWKITNVLHVLHIFQNHKIPLKISQYFIKGANGIFEEWVPPNETDRKNQHIKPHLYSTYLKVGKHDPNSSENVPFIIEWIPDILPQSKLGELTITFEFGRNSPRDEMTSSKIVKNAKQQM